MSLEGFGGIQPARGGIAQGMVEVPGVDPAWVMPVVVVRGAKPGPTLALTAGVHACEYVPMEALRQFVFGIDRAKLSGTVVAVLLVNSPGFGVRSIFTNPRDGKNLNRVFPGSKTGSASERVADFLMTELVAKADAYVDCHCGDMVEAMIPFALWTRTGDAELDAKSERMAMAYTDSLVFVADLGRNRGKSYGEAAALGLPALIGEVGQQGICDAVSVGLHLQGMRNMLSVLGMVDSGPVPTAPQVMGAIHVALASVSGYLHMTALLGDSVVSGQKVGEVRDAFGEMLEEVYAPTTGIVMCITTGLAISVGECMLEVGESV